MARALEACGLGKWQEKSRSLGNGRGEIYDGRNENMRVSLEGREPDLGGGLRYSGWCSRVFTFQPQRAFCGHLQRSARASDNYQVERDLGGKLLLSI